MALEDPGAKWDKNKDDFARVAYVVLVVALVAGGLGVLHVIPERIAAPAAVGGVIGSIFLGVLSIYSDRRAYEARQPRTR